MTKLFIDDIRDPVTDDFVVVRSYSESLVYLRAFGCPEFISFDHDLGDAKENTGFDVVKWMVERDLNNNGEFIPDNFEYYVHSANPVGKANIIGLLENYLGNR